MTKEVVVRGTSLAEQQQAKERTTACMPNTETAYVVGGKAKAPREEGM